MQQRQAFVLLLVGCTLAVLSDAVRHSKKGNVHLRVPNEVQKKANLEEEKKAPASKPSVSVGSFANFYQAGFRELAAPGAVHFAAGAELPPVDEEGYKKDWGTEHRSEEYPKAAEGKMHHPDYNG